VAILGGQHQRFIRAPRFDKFDFTPTATPISINVPASSRDYDQNDAELTETTSELNETQMQLGPASLGGVNATFRKSNVSAGYSDYYVNVDLFGRVYSSNDTYGSTYEANMIVSFPLLTKNIKVGVSKSGGTISRTFRGFKTGSLRAYLWEQMRLRVGIDDGNGYVTREATTMSIFNARSWTNETVTRNPNHVLADVDLSACAVFNSWNTAYGRGGGILITPLSMIAARHYAPNSTNHVVMFASMAGAVYKRTIVSVRNTSTASTGRDVRICKLDSPLPPDITPAKVLPKNYLSYLPGANTTPRVPFFYTDQNKQIFAGYAILSDSASASTWSGSSTAYTGRGSHPWYKALVDGDSGSPTLLAINGQLVTLGLPMYATPSGSFLSGLEYDLINSNLATSGDTGRLIDVDLSSFTTYAA